MITAKFPAVFYFLIYFCIENLDNEKNEIIPKLKCINRALLERIKDLDFLEKRIEMISKMFKSPNRITKVVYGCLGYEGKIKKREYKIILEIISEIKSKEKLCLETLSQIKKYLHPSNNSDDKLITLIEEIDPEMQRTAIFIVNILKRCHDSLSYSEFSDLNLLQNYTKKLSDIKIKWKILHNQIIHNIPTSKNSKENI